MVERELKGITIDQLTGAQQAVIETGKRMTAGGKSVPYILNAKLPFSRIVEAMDLTP